MNLRPLWTIGRWVGGILGYVFGSLVVAIAAPFLYLIHICNGNCDDAPGTGLFLGFIAADLLAFFLAIGFFLLIEILYCRLLGKTKIRWLRLALRQTMGLLSLAGPCWIYLFWPAIGYRNRFESRPTEILIYVFSTLLFLIAVCLPFRFRRGKPAATPKNLGESPQSAVSAPGE